MIYQHTTTTKRLLCVAVANPLQKFALVLGVVRINMHLTIVSFEFQIQNFNAIIKNRSSAHLLAKTV